jgi:hypothetical protein
METPERSQVAVRVHRDRAAPRPFQADRHADHHRKRPQVNRLARGEDTERRIGARRGADDGAVPAAHIAPIATYAAKRPVVTPKILETFFLVEDKRAMRTRIFQDLLRHAAFGRNVHVCAARPSTRIRDPAFSLNISHGRSARARRFRGAEEPSRKRLRIRASAFPKYQLCADRAFQGCMQAREQLGGFVLTAGWDAVCFVAADEDADLRVSAVSDQG